MTFPILVEAQDHRTGRRELRARTLCRWSDHLDTLSDVWTVGGELKTCNTAHERAVRQVVTRVLGPSIDSLVPIPTYPDSIVYEASGDGIAVVFKGIDPDGRDESGITLEAWAVETAASRGIPTPRVLEVDASGATFPGAFFIMQKLQGQPLSELESAEDRDRLAIRLGEHLRSLHEVQVGGFGWLDEDHYRATGRVRGSVATWREALLSPIPDALEYLAAHALTREQDARLRSAIRAAEPVIPDVRDPRLVHGDFGMTHVFVDPSQMRITGIVDFGERASGDPAWDFIESEPQHLAALVDGYGLTGAARVDLYRRIDLYKLVKAVPWAAKWHNRDEPQVIDWLLSLIS